LQILEVKIQGVIMEIKEKLQLLSHVVTEKCVCIMFLQTTF